MKAICCFESSAISGCAERQWFWFVFHVILSEKAFGEAHILKPKRSKASPWTNPTMRNFEGIFLQGAAVPQQGGCHNPSTALLLPGLCTSMICFSLLVSPEVDWNVNVHCQGSLFCFECTYIAPSSF